jgi:putative acetyltransferase
MLRKATQADFSFVYELYMHPQTNPYLLYEEMPKPKKIYLVFSILSSKFAYKTYQIHEARNYFRG